MKLFKPTLIFFFCLFHFLSVLSKVPDGKPVDVNVFLDADRRIDDQHIRQEISYVNYTRTDESSNLHLLITTQSTGGNGREYTFFFNGAKYFEGIDDTLYYFSSPDKTSSEIRDEYTNVIRMGLARYLAHGLQLVNVEFNGNQNDNIDAVKQDNWKNWVFQIEGDARLEGEETQRSHRFNYSFEAQKTTPEWRIEFDFRKEYNEDWYENDGDEITSVRKEKRFDNLTVKSLGNHLAVGFFTGISTSTFDNIKMEYWFRPAIEYNFYSYAMSTRRQLRLTYLIGYSGREYLDTTIFNKISEDLIQQTFNLGFKIQERWGSASASASAKNYLHDFKKNSFRFELGADIRIWKGLSFEVDANYSILHDRLSIMKGDVTIEEILLKQRQQGTSYSYWTRIGLSFNFGSLYNNVVNPRLTGHF